MRIKLDRNKVILTVLDILVIIAACLFSSLLFKSEINITKQEIKTICNSAVISIFSFQILYRIFNLYRNITRYESGRDYLTYLVASLISTFVIMVTKLITRLDFLPIKELACAGLCATSGMILYRVIIRTLLMNKAENFNLKYNKTFEGRKNLLIIGAGMAARDIIKQIHDTLQQTYNIVGIIDDNPQKWNYSISGVKILGNRYEIKNICEKYKVQEIFFSIAKISSDNKKEILALCQETNAKVRMLPSTEALIKNRSLLHNLKDVEIEDLLGRDPILLDNNNIENLIKNNVVLVTGGGGSIGSELCRQIITYSPKTLIILDIYENNLYNIELELKSKYKNMDIRAIVGSVRDKNKMESIFEKYRPNLVFHAAAHKHVPLMEISPLEAIKNNVLGTKNVVDCADKYETERFILISTDKAVNPTNIMGATKRMCEMIIQAKNKVSKTEYAAVRFGNVLGSNGSVVPLFKKQIKEGGPLTVTHKDITRFFMTIPEAVGLVLQAMSYANGGEIFVLDMGEPVKIYDLAVSLIKLSGFRPNIDIPIEITGLRPGEKLYEELLMSEEGLEHTKHNKIFVAEPLDLTAEEVENRVDKLRELVSSEEHSKNEIKEVMKSVVPTFIEPEEKNKKIVNYKKEIEDIEENRKKSISKEIAEKILIPKEIVKIKET